MIKFIHSATKSIIFFLFLLIAITGCNKQQKFTPEKWDMGNGLDFPMRDVVVDNLVQTHKLKGLSYWNIRDSLGYPQYRDSAQFYYQLIDTYNNMRKHDHIKRLIFYMDKKMAIIKVEIYDNKAPVKSRFF
jgi:hypothetical protein